MKEVPFRCSGCNKLVGYVKLAENDIEEQIVDSTMQLESHDPNCSFLKALKDDDLAHISMTVEKKPKKVK